MKIAASAVKSLFTLALSTKVVYKFATAFTGTPDCNDPQRSR